MHSILYTISMLPMNHKIHSFLILIVINVFSQESNLNGTEKTNEKMNMAML